METTDLKTLYMSNLKAVKDSLDKSVAKMASDINMPARTITSYVTGERTVSLEFVTHICKKYNVNANWFCTGEGEMFNNPPEIGASTDYSKENLRHIIMEVLKDAQNKGII